MEEEQTKGMLDNQFIVFMFLIIGLIVLFIMFDVIFFDSAWWAAILSSASMLIALVVYIQLDIRRKIPWIWALGSFLVIPVIYFIVAALVS